MKIETPLPSKTLRAYLEKHPEPVAAISYGSGFDTPSGKAYDVLIASGWSISLYGDHMHTIIEAKASDVIAQLKTAVYCGCNKIDCCCCHG